MTVRRVCVFSRLWEPGLGDLMQRNILLHVIRRAYPAAALVHVLNATSVRRFGEFLDGHTFATEVMVCPDYDDDEPTGWSTLLGEVTERDFDLCVVDPDSRGLGGAEAARCGIGVRIGYATGHSGTDGLTTAIRIPRPIFGAPDLLDYAATLRATLGLPPARPADLLPPARYRHAPGPFPHGPVVALHPGGAPHWNRRWPQVKYAELAIGLKDVAGGIVLIGAAEERAELAVLEAAVRDAAPGLEVQVSAGESFDRIATVLSAAAVLVGNDSAPAHLAAALGTPTVVLYGPTSTEFMWSRVYPRHHGINLHRDCQQVRNLPRGPGTATMPCASRCTYPYLGPAGPYPRCLADIPVERVLEAVRHRLPASSPAREPHGGHL